MTESPGGDGVKFDDDAQLGHETTEALIYGPVQSRRYGRTLGVNPMPRAAKICNFDCVYCQLGWTPAGQHEATPSNAEAWADLEELERAFAAIPEGLAERIDVIMLCGNGEPTLHPRFAEFAGCLRALRDQHLPGLPIAMLTNGTRLHEEEVHVAASALDEVSVKLDAGSIHSLKKVNLPHGPVDMVKLARAVSTLPRPMIQSCFFDGTPNNLGDADIADWIYALRQMSPHRVDIYTLSRATPTTKIRPATGERLERIASRLESALEVGIRVQKPDPPTQDQRRPT